MGCGTCLGICQCGGTRCGAVTTVPLYKTAAQATVRPIGIKPCLARVIHKVVTRQSRQAFIEYFEPQQLAMSPSGPHQLVNGLRMLGEANRSFVTLKSDIKNAFPSVSRSRILNVRLMSSSCSTWSGMLLRSWLPPQPLSTGVMCGGRQEKGLLREIPRQGRCSLWPGTPS